MTENNVEIIRRLYDAFETHDFNVIAELFDTEVEIYQSELLPWGGNYKGHDGAVTFFTGLLQHIDSKVTLERFIEAGDHVVEVGRTAGTTTNGSVPFDVPEVHVWQVREGKIVRMESYVDVPLMRKALS
ncbi:nuclear transport factor 2 family protein [Planotetraspora phitsanulokensis]|uniref:Ketosteroid isomerase n=1 Tax=Planotetraspora phitsanulokensis TaxID=575192 RepID=A0A8J3XCC1_9ACTN|nr:nuclear transport factor 2 family protein [Planotetraspora phitsanulokensis]GII35194.1 ketosteroid isomerase [Planotetraspora phitsanulokensis]